MASGCEAIMSRQRVRWLAGISTASQLVSVFFVVERVFVFGVAAKLM